MKNFVSSTLVCICSLFLLLSCKQAKDVVDNNKKQVELKQMGFNANLASGVKEISLSTILTGTIETVELNLKNTGKYAATELKFNNISDSRLIFSTSKEGTCGKSLATGETCTLYFEFYSETPDKFNISLPITYNDGINKLTSFNINFIGVVGKPASIEVDFERLDFGLIEEEVPSGSQIIKLTNIGTLPAKITLIDFPLSKDPDTKGFNIFSLTRDPLKAIVEPAVFPGFEGNCPEVIQPGEENSCTIMIQAFANLKKHDYVEWAKIKYRTLGVDKSGGIDVEDSEKNVKLIAKSVEKVAVLVPSPDFSFLGNLLNNSPIYNVGVKNVMFKVKNVGYNIASDIRLENNSINRVPMTREKRENMFPRDCLEVGSINRNEECSLSFVVKGEFPTDRSWPVTYSNIPIAFSFNDGKPDHLRAKSSPIQVGVNFKGEAHLFVSGSVGGAMTQFPESTQELPDELTSTWEHADWTKIIKAPEVVSQTIALKNGFNIDGARVDATEVRIAFKNNSDKDCSGDGLVCTQVMTIKCGNAVCPQTMTISPTPVNLTVEYNPCIDSPYNEDKERVLSISYKTGTRTKTYNIVIKTLAIPIPSLRLGMDFGGVTGAAKYGAITENLSAVLPTMATESRINIKPLAPTTYDKYFYFVNYGVTPVRFNNWTKKIADGGYGLHETDNPSFEVKFPTDSNYPSCEHSDSDPGINMGKKCYFYITYKQNTYTGYQGKVDSEGYVVQTDAAGNFVLDANGKTIPIASLSEPHALGERTEGSNNVSGLKFTNGIDPTDIKYGKYTDTLTLNVNATLATKATLVPDSITIDDVGQSTQSLDIVRLSRSNLALGYTQLGTWGLSGQLAALDPTTDSSFVIITNENKQYIKFTAPTSIEGSTSDICRSGKLNWTYRGGFASDPLRTSSTSFSACALALPEFRISGTSPALVSDAMSLGTIFQGQIITGTMTLQNIGQTLQSYEEGKKVTVSLVNVGETAAKFNQFTIVPPASDSNCTVSNETNQKFDIDIVPTKTCTFTIKFTASAVATVYGQVRAKVLVEYYDHKNGKDANGYPIRVINPVKQIVKYAVATGQPEGNIAISTLPSGSKNYYEATRAIPGDTGKTFSMTFTNNVTGGTNAVIKSVALVDYGPDNSNCKENNLATTQTSPPSPPSVEHTEWLYRNSANQIVAKEIVNGNRQPTGKTYNSIRINSNTCTVNKQIATGSVCTVTLGVTPEFIDKISSACLKVEYLKSPSALTSYTIYTKPLMALGTMVGTSFLGWKEILAYGANRNDSFAKVVLSWWKMGVNHSEASIVSYDIYRKLKSDSSYPPVPVNANPIIPTDGTETSFQYTDLISTLPEKSILSYKIVAKIKMVGDDRTFLSDLNREIDKELRVVLPLNNTNLIHQWTANMKVCSEMLGGINRPIDRLNNYRCTYLGSGNVNNYFDLKKDLIVDRFETGVNLDNRYTNAPTKSPSLFKVYSDASAACTGNPSININGVLTQKRLLSRQEYMIATYKNTESGCVTNSTSLKATGRDEGLNCQSLFGVEDAVGNAWEFLQDTLTSISTTAPASWTYNGVMATVSKSVSLSWPFTTPYVDCTTEQKLFTYYSRAGYTTGKCVNDLFGIPINTASCPVGSRAYSAALGQSMGVVANKNYFGITGFPHQTLGALCSYTTTLPSTPTTVAPLKRYLLAGGSYESNIDNFGPYGDNRNSFGAGIPASRWSMMWVAESRKDTLKYPADTQLQQIAAGFDSTIPDTYSGGAARCVLEVP